jgi:hypothetical protein
LACSLDDSFLDNLLRAQLQDLADDSHQCPAQPHRLASIHSDGRSGHSCTESILGLVGIARQHQSPDGAEDGTQNGTPQNVAKIILHGLSLLLRNVPQSGKRGAQSMVRAADPDERCTDGAQNEPDNAQDSSVTILYLVH